MFTLASSRTVPFFHLSMRRAARVWCTVSSEGCRIPVIGRAPGAGVAGRRWSIARRRGWVSPWGPCCQAPEPDCAAAPELPSLAPHPMGRRENECRNESREDEVESDRMSLPNRVRTISDSKWIGFHPAENGWVERAAAEKRTGTPWGEHQRADQQAASILLPLPQGPAGCGRSWQQAQGHMAE